MKTNITQIVWQIESWKTTLLKEKILEDINNWKNIIVLDPHWELYNSLKNNESDNILLFEPLKDKETTKNLFNLEEVFNWNKSILFQLWKWILGENISDSLTKIILQNIYYIFEENKIDKNIEVSIYIDEFQHIPVDNLVKILYDIKNKYFNVSIIFAKQYMLKLDESLVKYKFFNWSLEDFIQNEVDDNIILR